MDFFKRFRATILAVTLAIFGIAQITSHVVAQDAGFAEHTASGQVSIAAGTPATLISASTGQVIKVKCMKLATVTTGGTVSFYSDADATKNVFTAYAPVSTSVNNNVSIGRDILPQNGPYMLQSLAGKPFCAQLNGATLVYEIVYELQ